jgi:DNA-binding transcriptional LysR family regulator
MEFDTTRLRSFLHVAERGTVVAAAEDLGFTGPAVSQHLTKLEAQLGVPLFERAGGRLMLSPHGQQLLPIAKEMIDLVDVAVVRVATPPADRRVRISGFASAIRTIVLPTMARFADVEWDIRDAEDDDALRALRLGMIDIAIVQEYDNIAESRDESFHYTRLATDRLRLVVPPDQRRTVSLSQMAATGWLVNGTGTRCEAAANQVLASGGISPRVVGRIGDTTTLFALVAAGVGATLAPDRMVPFDVDSLVISTANVGVSRQIFAVQRLATRSVTSDIVTALRQSAA